MGNQKRRRTVTFHVASFGTWFRVRRRAGESGELPDWVWAAPDPLGGAPTAGFLEAKGTYYRNQLLRSLSGAHTQLRQLIIEYRSTPTGAWIELRSKDWAVATGWATATPMKRGFADPILRVEDPDGDGEAWTEKLSAAFYLGLRRLQIAQSLAGLGARGRTLRILEAMAQPDIPLPSDTGQRARVWRVDVKGGALRTIIGVEVRPLTGDGDVQPMIAGIDEQAAARGTATDGAAPLPISPERGEFILVRADQAERLRDDLQD